jgi:hypothetical protein
VTAASVIMDDESSINSAWIAYENRNRTGFIQREFIRLRRGVGD